jgi:hypothetical protein
VIVRHINAGELCWRGVLLVPAVMHMRSCARSEDAEGFDHLDAIPYRLSPERWNIIDVDLNATLELEKSSALPPAHSPFTGLAPASA